MNRTQTVFATCWLAFLTGCVTPPRQPPTSRPAPAATDARKELQARAEQLWKARLDEDWMTVYLFEDEQTQRQVDVTAYARSKEEGEQFVTKAYTVQDVAVQDDLGWVSVDATLAIRKFPNVPARQVQRWEKWYREKARWLPVPPEQLDAYPSAPAERDLSQEPRLAARSEALWQARRERNWSRVFQIVTPSERSAITEDALGEEENKSLYLSRRTHWVEAREDRGQVRITLEVKMNDPSATKLPPQASTLNEHWVKVNGEWYLSYASTPR